MLFKLVASLGDTSGDGAYSSADSALAARLAMRLDSGLVNYPVVIPSLVADVSGNGTVSMLDAAMIAGVSGGSQGLIVALRQNQGRCCCGMREASGEPM